MMLLEKSSIITTTGDDNIKCNVLQKQPLPSHYRHRSSSSSSSWSFRRLPTTSAIIVMVSLSTLLLGGFCCMSYFMRCSAGRVPRQTPLGVPWQGEPVSISRKVYNSRKLDFLPHENWLGMELDYQYVYPVAKALNTTETPLLTRGESHITVITPPEFSTLATANVTIDEINAIALDHKIQKTKFEMICLGKESAVVEDELYIVYQIIVDAPNLEAIREAIFKLYVNKGGNSALFDPHAFWPHITVAFTVGDLFENNGVYKGLNVCHSPLDIKRW